MRPARALLIVAAALALAGCSQRDRSNPLDPANPQTGGRPSGFNAIAGYASVQLQWNPQPELGVDGFQVYRRLPGDSLWRPLGGPQPSSASRFLDSGLVNGERVRYRLDWWIDGAPAGRPVEDEATPGPLRPWVADPGAGAVLRLSPDGRDVNFTQTSFGVVGRIAVDPIDGWVWASDTFDGIVWSYDPFSRLAVAIPGVSRPDAMAISPFDHSVWVCDLAGGVSHFRRDGSVPTPGRLAPIDGPAAIAANPADASIWVVERGGNRLRHFAANGTPLGAANVGAPSRVAVDSLTRVAWVTSYELGRIWRVGEAGQIVDSTSVASGPIGIAIDRPHGLAWVADDRGGRLLGLDLNSLAVRVTTTAAGAPYDVAVDEATGEVWALSRSSRAVTRLAPDGTRIDGLAGFDDPVEIRIDPGR